MTKEIRPANSSDADAIVGFDPIAPSDSRRVEFIRRSIEQGECYVYEDEVICGYGVLNYRFFGCGFIDLLIVHQDYRRKGIGLKLMQHMQAKCSNPKLFTSTNQSNLPMQALLKKLAFKRSGIIENLDDGDPELIYFKAL